MVEQPYTVCRPVTTSARRSRSAATTSVNTPMVPGPVVEAKVRVPVQEAACESCGLFGCFHQQKRVTATVAVQCPPRMVSAASLRVAPGGPQRLRDPLRPRNDGPPGARRRPAATWRRSGSSRSPSPPASTSPRSASSRTRSAPASMVAEERVEIDPGDDLPVRRRRARRARTRSASARWSPRSGSRPSP